MLKRKINNGLRSEIRRSHHQGHRLWRARYFKMEDALMKMARSSELGIKAVDVRIKQINLPVEVSSSIYQRMRAERTAVAREHRSQGREQAEILRADIDRKVTVMIADAESNARQLRGEGDAEAAKIYADSYKKDPRVFQLRAQHGGLSQEPPVATT
ncbi:SPFH domain-containing protein [Aeromonas dhakensis]